MHGEYISNYKHPHHQADRTHSSRRVIDECFGIIKMQLSATKSTHAAATSPSLHFFAFALHHLHLSVKLSQVMSLASINSSSSSCTWSSTRMFNASKQSRREEGQAELEAGRRGARGSWESLQQPARHVCIAAFPSCCCRALSCLRRRLSKDSSGVGHGTETKLQLRRLCRQTDSRAEIVRLHTATTHIHIYIVSPPLQAFISHRDMCTSQRKKQRTRCRCSSCCSFCCRHLATCVLSQEAYRQTSSFPPLLSLPLSR